MNGVLRCEQGHEWASGDEGSFASPLCPVCQQPGFRASPPSTQVPELTLRTEELRHDQARTEQSPGSSPAPALSGLPSVPGYDVLRELGRGGMGVVYLARQRGLNRLVALKMILAGAHADSEDVVRFRNEAEAVARLHHPNITQVYEVGEVQGLPFFSLEFAEGGSLERQLAGDPQPPRDAAALVETLALAMAFAHDNGVLHRDLKPANILLSGEGRVARGSGEGREARRSGEGRGASDERRQESPQEPSSPRSPLATRPSPLSPSPSPLSPSHSPLIPKITDFGLAKRMDGGASRTHSGTILGTPSYMAPEQARGAIHDLGPWVDVYGLGAILYELLTGRPPFRAQTAWDTLHQVLNDEPVPPSQLQPKVPRDLETICLKCLQKEPRRRYLSARELALDLRRFLQGEPIQARRTGTAERLLKWARRRPAVAALSGLSLLLALTGVALVTWQWQEARAAYQTAEQARDNEEKEKTKAQKARTAAENHAQAETDARIEAEKQRRRAEDALTRARLLLAGNRLAWAERESLLGNMRESQNLLDTIEPAERHWEWYHLQLMARSEALLLELNGQNFLDGVFGPDRKEIATIGNDGYVRKWDAVSGKELFQVRAHSESGFGIDWSPDGKWIASCGWDAQVCLLDARTGEVRTTIKHEDKVYRVLFSPDGKQLATSSQDRTVRLWDLSGKSRAVCRGHTSYVVGIAFSSDGKRLASAGTDGTVRIWDTATGEEKQQFRGHEGAVRGVAFSPDDKRLASAAADMTARVWDVDSGKTIGVLRGHTGAVTDVAYSPDGKRLATASRDRSVRVWDASNGRQLLVLRGHARDVVSVRFSGDGEQLVTGAFDTTARVWDALRDIRSDVLSGHTETIYDLAVSQDGKRLASAGFDGRLIVWNLATASAEITYENLAAPLSSVGFDPAGKLIAGGDSTGVIHLWELGNPRELHVLRPKQSKPTEVLDLAFQPRGHRLATASEGMVRVWDVRNGELLRELPVGEGRVWSIAFSPDGSRMVAGVAGGKLLVWNVEGYVLLKTLNAGGDSVYRVAFHPGGRQMLSYSSGNWLRLWDVTTWRESLVKQFPFRVYDAALHPADHRIALGCEDGRVRLLDSNTGEEVFQLRGHTGEVFSVLFDPAGQRLFSVGSDRLIKVWKSTRPARKE